MARKSTCILASLVIGAVPLLIGSGARADLVSISFTAQILSGPFGSAGTQLIGSYNLDTTVAAQVNDPTAPIQNAAVFPAVQSLTVSIPTLNDTWTGSTPPQTDNLFIHHHYLGPTQPDSYFVDSTQPSGPGFTDSFGNVLTPVEIGIALTQNAGTLFSDASILPLDVTLSDFDGAHFFIQFSDGSGHVEEETAFLTSFGPTAVPSPIAGAGLPGLIFASGGLFAWCRRKRKAQAVA